MSINIGLILVAIVIVVALAVYAGKLLSQLTMQKKQLAQQLDAQQQTINARNEKIAESIRLIAKALVEQQCELSEGAIRISRLLETYHVNGDANYPQQFPAIHQLDQQLAQYPTHKAYKALKRQERMRFDVKRAQWEQELQVAISEECRNLLAFNL
ncbi:MAG: DUF2489 domain-containing protein [Gammaproteobacteria bacterium]|nr:DUF2489 domain-containing protein [Gammaproteobacteria bacterium]